MLRIISVLAGVSVAAFAACGGTVKERAPGPESSTLGGATATGEGGAPSDDGAQGDPDPTPSGAAGARSASGGAQSADGGAPSIPARGAGGARSTPDRGAGGTLSTGTGGAFPCDIDFTSATGGATWIEVPGERPGDCGYILNPDIWTSTCPVASGCLHLDPSSSVPDPADAAAPASAPVVELPLCEPPLPGRTYMFAFDADPSERSGGFEANTGSCACAGYNLGYLRYEEQDHAPSNKQTYCFRVDGRYLQDRLSVVSYSGDVSNLRAVPSCDCSIKLPSNYVNCATRPAVGGAPTCD